MVPIHDDPEAQLSEVRKYLVDYAVEQGTPRERAEFEAERLIKGREFAALSLKGHQQSLAEVIDESFWVYSVCATQKPILMWSHYADGHKGLSLHFAPHVAPFNQAYEVHYTDEYPAYPFPQHDRIAPDESARVMVLTKAEGWRYEAEYRAIRVVGPGEPAQLEFRRLGLVWDGQYATLPDTALTGVTLGAAMTPTVAADLTDEIAERRPMLEVWQARANDEGFNLDFHRVR